MLPIVTAAEMGAIDAAAPEPVEVLIGRAGAAVARTALAMLGGVYGRRVVVVAGPGNNGADGRAAAEILRARGVHVSVIDAPQVDGRAAFPDGLLAPGGHPVDLLIDAAYGTGFRGTWTPPSVGDVAVLAVDIPTGVDATDGRTGESRPWRASHTVTFQALKPGLVVPAGRRWCGEIEVADIGLDVGGASAAWVEADDVRQWWPRRAVDAHKWSSSVRVVGGSASMPGAAFLAAAAAARAGAGMVQLASPGGPVSGAPVEAVQVVLPPTDWTGAALADRQRVGALVVGPGLGLTDETAASVGALFDETGAERPVAMVVDGDALTVLARRGASSIAGRAHPTVLTPHDGEYARLVGEPPGPDRFAAARRLAEMADAVVLLKGPLTIVAEPAGDALAVGVGDARLATAGTGDVLSGIVAAALALALGEGDPAGDALHGVVDRRAVCQLVAAAAYVHGLAGRRAGSAGVIASDVVAAIPTALATLIGDTGQS